MATIKLPRLNDRRRTELGPPSGLKNRRVYIERRLPDGRNIVIAGWHGAPGLYHELRSHP